KLAVAKQLNKLKVDYIEAAFPSSSESDFKAVKVIATHVGNTDDIMISALARAVKGDIDSVYESIKAAEKPLIHMVLGTCDIHVENKFSKSKDQFLDIGVEEVKYAKKILPDIQYSIKDASISDSE